jgi:hypothetical protein
MILTLQKSVWLWQHNFQNVWTLSAVYTSSRKLWCECMATLYRLQSACSRLSVYTQRVGVKFCFMKIIKYIIILIIATRKFGDGHYKILRKYIKFSPTVFLNDWIYSKRNPPPKKNWRECVNIIWNTKFSWIVMFPREDNSKSRCKLCNINFTVNYDDMTWYDMTLSMVAREHIENVLKQFRLHRHRLLFSPPKTINKVNTWLLQNYPTSITELNTTYLFSHKTAL